MIVRKKIFRKEIFKKNCRLKISRIIFMGIF